MSRQSFALAVGPGNGIPNAVASASTQSMMIRTAAAASRAAEAGDAVSVGMALGCFSDTFAVRSAEDAGCGLFSRALGKVPPLTLPAALCGCRGGGGAMAVRWAMDAGEASARLVRVELALVCTNSRHERGAFR